MPSTKRLPISGRSQTILIFPNSFFERCWLSQNMMAITAQSTPRIRSFIISEGVSLGIAVSVNAVGVMPVNRATYFATYALMMQGASAAYGMLPIRPTSMQNSAAVTGVPNRELNTADMPHRVSTLSSLRLNL